MKKASCETPGQDSIPLDPLGVPHGVETGAILRAFQVDPDVGLRTEEIAERKKRYGVNALQAVKRPSVVRILAAQFLNLIVGLLFAAAIIAWITEDHLEAAAILVVLLLNALIGFFTEWQAGRALDALRKQMFTSARVRRDGHEMTLDAKELVPGDFVTLNAGDRVPADARILKASSLRTEESALTGESATVEKNTAPVAVDAPLAERYSMLYLGTTIVAGRGKAVITATGGNTELGRIGQLVASAETEPTPLERSLEELGRLLVYMVLAIAVVVALAGLLRGNGLWLMVEVSISLAVAAIPEALPAVTTLILALGVLRMARQNALVRRLSAVETLGSTTIICTDKTGTLTENRMTVREFQLSDGTVKESDGKPLGAFVGDNLLYRAVRAGVLCNEASFHAASEEETHSIGDPTETALLTAAHSFGMNVEEERQTFLKIKELPFEAAAKRMITVHQVPEKKCLAILKGAPAVVLEACSHYAAATENLPLNSSHKEGFLAVNQGMAERALRVLAVAEKYLSVGDPETDVLYTGYTFLGFVGMIDPPRPGVAEAIRAAHQAGIRIVMLTGDQIHTAKAIARELNLSGEVEPIALHAKELINAPSERIAELARRTDVFARVSPEDKLRIVESLMKADEVVAVTGDGVNDAPALKRANIGIAMGKRGTEVAKEAADLILTDDNFATLVQAIEGGRVIYSNIIKFVHLMFSKNLAEVFIIFGAILVGWPLPLLPLQILWLNLVMDVFPAMALAVEPADPTVMQQPPRSSREGFLSRGFLFLILWQSLVLTVIVLAAYGWALDRYGAGSHARTMALFTIVGSQLGHMFNCRSRTHSALRGIGKNPFVWGAVLVVFGLQGLAIIVVPLVRVLGTHSLNATDWAVVFLTIILPIPIVEASKWFASRKARPLT